MTEWEVRGEKAEFERAATQKSTISNIMASRFQKAKFKDSDQNVTLEKTKAEKLHQEKIDAVKMGFFGPVTHQGRLKICSKSTQKSTQNFTRKSTQNLLEKF